MQMNDYEREHNAILRSTGAECAVLLKSDGSFPLPEPCTLALYGSGARHTIKGGTGSGEVNSRCYVTAEQGLEAAGFTISTRFWLESYDAITASAHKAFIRRLKQQAREHHTMAVVESMGAVMPEPEYNIPLTGKGDAAVYVLSRISGEGSDRRAVGGDILLSESEKRDILALSRRFERFLLVLNVGGVVDLTPVQEVGNILLLSQLGVETGSILADLILGRSYPSGKLTTTWSAWGDYPAIGSFGEKEDTRYTEGVYVGYRYFDSVGKKPLFPFGFGLGYTSFSMKPLETVLDGETVSLRAEVVNTGNGPGREVAQLYVSAPQARIDKPWQTLAAFAKTGELMPGERTELTLSFGLRDLASYDAQNAAWLLEKGDYVLRLGSSSAETKAAAVLRLDADKVTRRVKNCLGKPDFTDWQPEKRETEPTRFAKIIPVSASSIRTETVDYSLSHPIDPEIRAKPRVDDVREEVRVLEIKEDGEVDDDGEGEPKRSFADRPLC